MDYDVIFVDENRNAVTDHRSPGRPTAPTPWRPLPARVPGGSRTVVVPPGARPTVITGSASGYYQPAYFAPPYMPAPSFASRFGMTTGEMIVVDVYNPQSNSGAALHRARDRARKPQPDPRLTWIDGSIGLLPLPDRSVSAVYVNQILSEFWLPEEQAQLLGEIRRILIPEGRLLIAERIRSQANLLLTGLITSSLPRPSRRSGTSTVGHCQISRINP